MKGKGGKPRGKYKLKIRVRRCKRCDNLYESKYRTSNVCPNCDRRYRKV